MQTIPVLPLREMIDKEVKKAAEKYVKEAADSRNISVSMEPDGTLYCSVEGVPDKMVYTMLTQILGAFKKYNKTKEQE